MKKKLPFWLTLLLLTGCNGKNDVSNSGVSNPQDSFLTDENGFRYKEEWLTKENAFEEKISEHEHEELGISGAYFGRTRFKVQADPSSSMPVDIIYGTSFDQDYPKLRGKKFFFVLLSHLWTKTIKRIYKQSMILLLYRNLNLTLMPHLTCVF